MTPIKFIKKIKNQNYVHHYKGSKHKPVVGSKVIMHLREVYDNEHTKDTLQQR